MSRFGDRGKILHHHVWIVEENHAERTPEMNLTVL
jgi:hypothetical protein